ncbi:N-acetylmuramoyl-L-alanine amidase [Lentimonas sp. CC19]|nr:N-acetylmuramoyl-L-alanine amidase [Lentimonas sp. CC19]
MLFLRFVASAWALDASALAIEMSTRYAPYADWAKVMDVDVLARQTPSRYWRTPNEIVSERAEGALPLAGLHIALDPGHIGGAWADAEGRHFRITEDDFYVREGELVLLVAQRAREQLVALGAKVSLLREANLPVNPKRPFDYLELAATQVRQPIECTPEALWAYGSALRARAERLSIVTGELLERARLVNQEIQPDALISLHINAAAWPVSESESESESESDSEGESDSESESESEGDSKVGDDGYSDKCGDEKMLYLVDSNHLHALIFGCMSAGELQSGRQQAQLAVKLVNGSGAVELSLGDALMVTLAEATALPAGKYEGHNAILLDLEQPYLFARNLLMLRMVECPTVLLEPHVANSVTAYARIQAALADRAAARALADDDILVEYADAVVAGVLTCYADVSVD